MNGILIIGIVIIIGLAFGELAARLRLPKVTGYIMGGVLLNPRVFRIIPFDAVANTNLITNISLSVSTFAVGGTLFYRRLKRLGKVITCITLFEAECAFAAITLGILLILPFFTHQHISSWNAFLALSLLLGCLGSPTDPAGTLAVVRQYRSKGPVTSTMLSAAALDDMLGIVNYSIAVAAAATLIAGDKFTLSDSLLHPVIVILGSIALGCAFGMAFNAATRLIKRETDGFFIVLVIGLLALCYGTGTLLAFDELLATMTMGIIVVNFNVKHERIFKVLERYTEELIFVVFFTISGMLLNFTVLAQYLALALLFAVFRAAGKFAGTYAGAVISHAPAKVRKYTGAGLIAQGGIVIGLALVIKQNPAFSAIGDIILSLTIGTTVIHEFIGPVFAKFALERAGEIKIAPWHRKADRLER